MSDMSIKKERTSREEYLYHNTEVLLRKYREVVWSIEESTVQAQLSFELEMDCKLSEFLGATCDAGVDFSGTELQEHLRTLERNKKMLQIIDTSLNILRKKHKDGEQYYWILYYTYLSDKPCKNTDEIINNITEKTESLAWKTYFKKRKYAIESLSTIMWGFTSKDCKPFIEAFI